MAMSRAINQIAFNGGSGISKKKPKGISRTYIGADGDTVYEPLTPKETSKKIQGQVAANIGVKPTTTPKKKNNKTSNNKPTETNTQPPKTKPQFPLMKMPVISAMKVVEGAYSDKPEQVQEDVKAVSPYLPDFNTELPPDYMQMFDEAMEKIGASPKFESKYTEQVDSLFNQLTGYDKFSFDLGSNELYNQYKSMYTNNANKAMRDSMGNTAALTGGYGSSYSSAAGQQAYDNQMNNLNAVAIDIYDRAYQDYVDEYERLYNQYRAASQEHQNDWGRYYDSMNIAGNMAGANYNSAWDEYNALYNQYQQSIDEMRSNREYDLNMKKYLSDNEHWDAQHDLDERKFSEDSDQFWAGYDMQGDQFAEEMDYKYDALDSDNAYRNRSLDIEAEYNRGRLAQEALNSQRSYDLDLKKLEGSYSGSSQGSVAGLSPEQLQVIGNNLSKMKPGELTETDGSKHYATDKDFAEMARDYLMDQVPIDENLSDEENKERLYQLMKYFGFAE